MKGADLRAGCVSLAELATALEQQVSLSMTLDLIYTQNINLGDIAASSDLLLDHRLPLAFALSDWEVVDLGLDLRPPLAHVVLNVKDEGVLPEVGVHHLAGGLETHRWVQVGLQGRQVRASRGVKRAGGTRTEAWRGHQQGAEQETRFNTGRPAGGPLERPGLSISPDGDPSLHRSPSSSHQGQLS